MRPPDPALEQPLFVDNAEALDRFEALCAEDQALRAAEYENPDPKRRRLRVMCNGCEAPFCCNHRVDVDLVEALTIYRYAARNAPAVLEAALRRGKQLSERRDKYDDSQFFRRRVPCPFLVKGRCAVYEVRPHSCRTHYMASNPLKCRDELQPSETYAMDPDPTIIADMRKIVEDVRFFSLIEDVEITELAELLYLIQQLAKRPQWKAPITLGWAALEEE